MNRARLACHASLALLAVLIACGLVGPSRADDATPEILFPIPRTGWGFVNAQGNVVIQPQFTWAKDFYDGLAWVGTYDGYGLVNLRGEMIYKALSDPTQPDISTKQCSEGLIWVWSSTAKKFGCLDREGKLVIPPTYDDVAPFSDGLAAVNIGAQRVEDDQGSYMSGGKWGFVDRTGRLAIPLKYDGPGRFQEQVCWVYRDVRELIDPTGRVLLKLRQAIRNPTDFSEGLCIVHIEGPRGVRSGAIDKQGKWVIPPAYSGLDRFSQGLASFRNQSGKCGYLDRAGRPVIASRFDAAAEFSEGLAHVKRSGKWEYIDLKGKTVIEGAYAVNRPEAVLPINEAGAFRGGLARVHIGGQFMEANHNQSHWEGGKWQYIDTQGRFVAHYKAD